MYMIYYQICKKVNCIRGFFFKIPLAIFDEYWKYLLSHCKKSRYSFLWECGSVTYVIFFERIISLGTLDLKKLKYPKFFVEDVVIRLIVELFWKTTVRCQSWEDFSIVKNV